MLSPTRVTSLTLEKKSSPNNLRSHSAPGGSALWETSQPYKAHPPSFSMAATAARSLALKSSIHFNQPQGAAATTTSMNRVRSLNWSHDRLGVSRAISLARGFRITVSLARRRTAGKSGLSCPPYAAHLIAADLSRGSLVRSAKRQSLHPIALPLPSAAAGQSGYEKTGTDVALFSSQRQRPPGRPVACYAHFAAKSNLDQGQTAAMTLGRRISR